MKPTEATFFAFGVVIAGAIMGIFVGLYTSLIPYWNYDEVRTCAQSREWCSIQEPGLYEAMYGQEKQG